MSDSEDNSCTSDDSFGTCEVGGCNKKADEYTPCCHTGLCESHYSKLVKYRCKAKLDNVCDESNMCNECFNINGWSCEHNK